MQFRQEADQVLEAATKPIDRAPGWPWFDPRSRREGRERRVSSESLSRFATGESSTTVASKMARFAGFSATLFRGVFSYTPVWLVAKLVPQPPQHRASLVPRHPSAERPAVTAACQSPTARF